jgi:hypothetical protein
LTQEKTIFFFLFIRNMSQRELVSKLLLVHSAFRAVSSDPALKKLDADSSAFVNAVCKEQCKDQCASTNEEICTQCVDDCVTEDTSISNVDEEADRLMTSLHLLIDERIEQRTASGQRKVAEILQAVKGLLTSKDNDEVFTNWANLKTDLRLIFSRAEEGSGM